MSKKHHGGPAPVPPGNKPAAYPTGDRKGQPVDEEAMPPDDGASFQEQDPQRRLGGFTTAGEHARQQPGPLNDGGHPGR